MKHLGLFEGIGGFSLAAEWVGWETIAWVEKNQFCQKVLKKHFPNAKGHDDIKDFNGLPYRGKIDIITGGFPCQNISSSGDQKGINGNQSGLIWEMLRVCWEVSPKYILAENSPNLTKKGLDQILCSLAKMGYNAEWGYLPASKFGAYHKRARTYLIAYPSSLGCKRILQGLRKGDKVLSPPSNKIKFYSLPKSIDGLGDSKRIRKSDGLPYKLDRIKSCGNAIVPQVAYQIFKIIDQDL